MKLSFWVNPMTNGPVRAKPIDLESLGLQVEIPKAFFSKSLILRGLVSTDLVSEHISKFDIRQRHIFAYIDVMFYEVPEFTEKINGYSFKQVNWIKILKNNCLNYFFISFF